jgi:retron-type reverse transcriptase
LLRLFLYIKKATKTINNYRPISILTVLSKIFELCTKSRLLEFFTFQNLLKDCQHGYIPKKSTTTALTSLFEYIYNQLNCHNVIVNLSLDLSKAFDLVNHQFLCDKLERYGVRGTPLAFIKSYLSDRYQQVELTHSYENANITRIKSNLNELSTGVPQGSILGPLLFVIFINDLSCYITYKCIIYADDTNICITSKCGY